MQIDLFLKLIFLHHHTSTQNINFKDLLGGENWIWFETLNSVEFKIIAIHHNPYIWNFPICNT